MIRIEQFEIAGYQSLRSRYAFGPGLNVITGSNESGKSTLHEALTVALFGFSCEDRRRWGGRSPKDLRCPWTGPPFGGALTVVDQDERRLRIRWNFESDFVEVTDAATGELVLREQPQQRTDYTVGRVLLGLSRDDHRQLSCLFQDGLEPVRPSESLRQSLQRAAEMTAAPDGGFEGAEGRLKALLAKLGVNAGHYGAIATGRLARTQAQVRELEERLTRAAEERGQLEELTSHQVRLKSQLAEVAERIVAHEQAALRATAQRLAEDHASAIDLAKAARDTDANSSRGLPADLDGRVAAARDSMRNAERALAEAKQEEALAADEIAAAREAVRRAEATRDALALYADVDTSNEEAVRAELGRFESAAPAVTPPAAPPPRDPVLERFRTKRAELESQAAARPHERAGTASRSLFALAAVLAAVGIVGGVAVHPAAFALLIVAAILAIVVVRKPSRTITTAPQTFEDRPIPDLCRTADEEDRAWLRYEAAVSEHERVLAESTEVHNAAEAALLQLLGIDDRSTAPLVPRAEEYLRQCAKQRGYTEADRLVERATAGAREASAPAERVRLAEQSMHDAERELRRQLARASIEEDDLAVGLRAFDAKVATARTRHEEAECRADAAGRLEQLLAGRPVDELAIAARKAVTDLESHVAAHGTIPVASNGVGTQEDNAAARERLIADLADLRARIDEREANNGDPADLELQLDQARAELTRIMLYRDAARVAREQLAEAARAAHRKVAPHLNAALARALPTITRGRYREALVDDDLTIRVVAPDTGDLVDVERLSRGTRDQIALIERLELARLLDPSGGGAPLLLDDCFAHTDEHRLPVAVGLLCDVAQHRQVVVFTDDRDVVAAARSADGAVTVIELPDPVAVPAVRAA